MIKSIIPVLFFAGIAYASSYGGGEANYAHNVDAAVHSKHSVQVMAVPGSRQVGKTPVVDINSQVLPLTLRFNSHSTRINPIQKHISHAGQVYRQNAVDEPDVLIQNVRKPIIQEVREIITPFRQVTQEVRPVQEQINTLIARNQDGNLGGGAGGAGGAGIGVGGGAGGNKYEEKY